MIPPPAHQIRLAVRAALDEDIALGDTTTGVLFPDPVLAHGTIIAHQPMIVAGVAVARLVFAELDESLRIMPALRDGQGAKPGRPILTVDGDARSILLGERVALNFLQHLSGIATLTARFRQQVRGFNTKILDTRKTIPGLRALQKWAVRLGGGTNHRYSLGDGMLIKDNHVALLHTQQSGITEACRLAKERCPVGQRVIVETKTLEEVQGAVDGGADIILLDNMDQHTIRQAVELVKGRALIEASGGITVSNARTMAAAGAQTLSIGALTHSAPAANISMDLQPSPPTRKKPKHV